MVRGRRPKSSGMTLIEMMVTIAITLVLLLALMRAMQYLGSAAQAGRGQIEIAGEVRQALQRFEADMKGLTVQARAPGEAPTDRGYLEIVEGPLRDFGNGANTLLGDVDDWIAFTAISEDEPFYGRLGNTVIQSNIAEIVYCVRTRRDDNGTPYPMLCRRVLLVRPDLNGQNGLVNGAPTDFFERNDISARVVDGWMAANSLSDLADRRNRFLHAGAQTLETSSALFYADPIDLGTGNLSGEDIVLTRVLAMDVRVFDPYARLSTAGTGEALAPGDPGYNVTAAANNPVGGGAFVDLGFSRDPSSGNFAVTATPSAALAAGFPTGMFSGPPEPRCLLNAVTYDTWTMRYEHNGLDEDRDGRWDEGTNGVDDDGNGAVDDAAERETLPPYPFPLRGVRLTLRVFDEPSGQLRQASTVIDFTP